MSNRLANGDRLVESRRGSNDSRQDEVISINKENIERTEKEEDDIDMDMDFEHVEASKKYE